MLQVALSCSSLIPTPFLRAPASGGTHVQMSLERPGRRDLLQIGGLGLLGSAMPLGAAQAEELELVIPQAELLSSLATAPARNIIVTGANSGVGLAGAKLLTAAGHCVTLACRTKEKADAAAQACNEFAASTSAVGPAGGAKFNPPRRAGGVATGAECDLSSLASVRAFAASLQGQPLDSLVLNA